MKKYLNKLHYRSWHRGTKESDLFLGNFFDRLVYNAVPDFIDLHYNSFHWFTFNVADIFITIGISIFIIRSIFIKN